MRRKRRRGNLNEPLVKPLEPAVGHKVLYCRHPDRDVPGIECGYPLPCPYHTVVIDTTGPVPTVTRPVTRQVSGKQMDRLKEIAVLFHGEKKETKA